MSPTYYLRWQEEKMKQALAMRRVLVLAGARQCGKTTLSKKLSVFPNLYRTLDDVTLLAAALDDPHGFIRHGNELMIIDEIQRAPILLQAIKRDVDEHLEYGRFLLTGSANLQSVPGTKESLAGRMHTLRLRPLAMGEIRLQKPQFIRYLFEGSVADLQHSITEMPDYTKDACIADALRGGYPEVLRLSTEQDRRQWHRDYMNALIERDLKDIASITQKNAMHSLVEILAAWSSKFMNISAIGTTLSLSHRTLEIYIHALEALYIIERVRPWHKTDYDRVGKQDKLFMTDTGLMAAILRWRFEKVRFDTDLHGKLIETFVFNQLSAILDAQEDEYRLYHYRDREQREVDFILENEAGDVIGIEVKSGSAVTADAFKHLRWFGEHMAKDRVFRGFVLYTGNTIIPFGENMWALPMNSLWA